ncbi:MAG: glutaredoxin family protein [Gammaproteobacteria bacterium]
MIRLVLYGHSYCHLCEEMHKALLPWQQRLGFQLEIVDITGQPELEEAYGERVPVLMCGDEEICHYFLDESAMERKFRKA